MPSRRSGPVDSTPRVMNIFRRVFGKSTGSVDDPVFGPLVQRDGHWAGQMRWEHAPFPFALTVHRHGEAPSPRDRDAFQALSRDYPALRTGLQGALHQLWNEARSKAARDLPDFGGSLDLWLRIRLQGLGLHPDGHAELIYGLDEPSPFEGAFIVSVRGRDVEPLAYVE